MEAGAGRHDSRAAAGFEWVGGEDVGQERSREPGARSAANPSPSPKSKDGETLGKFSSDESLCPGDGPVMTTARLAMLPPAETRDGEVLELMNDEQTMLPWLPFLCPMRPENNAKRRKNQRKEFSEKKGMFLDLLDRKTGELVATQISDIWKVRTALGEGFRGRGFWHSVQGGYCVSLLLHAEHV